MHYPRQPQSAKSQLFSVLFQLYIILTGLLLGRQTTIFLSDISQSLTQARSPRWALDLAQPWALSLEKSQERARKRSQALSQKQSLSRAQSRAFSRVLAQLLAMSESLSEALSFSQSQALFNENCLSKNGKRQMEQLYQALIHLNYKQEKTVATALLRFLERSDALEWFEQQIQHPEWLAYKGLNAKEILPKDWELLDETGRPLKFIKRESLYKIKDWLADDEAMLAFAYPEGATDEIRQYAKIQLARLRTRSWAPHHFVEAILKDWPEDQPTIEYTMEAAEKRLIEDLQKVLGPEKEGSPEEK